MIARRLALDPAFAVASGDEKWLGAQVCARRIEPAEGLDLFSSIALRCEALGLDPRGFVARVWPLLERRGLVRAEGGVSVGKYAPAPKAAQGGGDRWAFLPGWPRADARLRSGWRAHVSRKHRGDARLLPDTLDQAHAIEVWAAYVRTYEARAVTEGGDGVTGAGPAPAAGSPTDAGVSGVGAPAVTPGAVTPGAVTDAVTAPPAALPPTTPTPPKGGGVVRAAAGSVTPAAAVTVPKGRSGDELARLGDARLGELIQSALGRVTSLFVSSGEVGRELLGRDARALGLAEGELRVMELHWRCAPADVRALFGIKRPALVTIAHLQEGGLGLARDAALRWWRGLSADQRAEIERRGGPAPYQHKLGSP
ncbi:MAG: hypothetical protein U0324_29240 [Polyangiales bacterium]